MMRASATTVSAEARSSVLARRRCCRRLFAMMGSAMLLLTTGLSSVHKAQERECNREYLFHVPFLTESICVVTEVYT
jgi:poly(3-hydroxybutyrate) depolymerase